MVLLLANIPELYLEFQLLQGIKRVSERWEEQYLSYMNKKRTDIYRVIQNASSKLRGNMKKVCPQAYVASAVYPTSVLASTTYISSLTTCFVTSHSGGLMSLALFISYRYSDCCQMIYLSIATYSCYCLFCCPIL